MDREELEKLLKKRPFAPLEMGLTDERSVIVRHPDQAVLTRRNVLFGLAHIEGRRKRLQTPAHGERFVADWMIVDLLHIVSAEPANGRPRGKIRQPRPRRGR